MRKTEGGGKEATYPVFGDGLGLGLLDEILFHHELGLFGLHGDFGVRVADRLQLHITLYFNSIELSLLNPLPHLSMSSQKSFKFKYS